jgi:hypothetical protein
MKNTTDQWNKWNQWEKEREGVHTGKEEVKISPVSGCMNLSILKPDKFTKRMKRIL